MNNKKILFLLILIPALIAAGVIVYFTFFHQFGPATCQRMVPNYILWISLVVIVLITVPTSYFLISNRLEEKLKGNMEIISNLVKKDEKFNENNKENDCEKNNLFLKFLNSSERKVTEKIIENKGNILQSEISRIEGMTRLRAHRTLKELESKGIIKIEKYGKTNRILLNNEIKNILFKK